MDEGGGRGGSTQTFEMDKVEWTQEAAVRERTSAATLTLELKKRLPPLFPFPSSFSQRGRSFVARKMVTLPGPFVCDCHCSSEQMFSFSLFLNSRRSKRSVSSRRSFRPSRKWTGCCQRTCRYVAVCLLHPFFRSGAFSSSSGSSSLRSNRMKLFRSFSVAATS